MHHEHHKIVQERCWEPGNVSLRRPARFQEVAKNGLPLKLHEVATPGLSHACAFCVSVVTHAHFQGPAKQSTPTSTDNQRHVQAQQKKAFQQSCCLRKPTVPCGAQGSDCAGDGLRNLLRVARHRCSRPRASKPSKWAWKPMSTCNGQCFASSPTPLAQRTTRSTLTGCGVSSGGKPSAGTSKRDWSGL